MKVFVDIETRGFCPLEDKITLVGLRKDGVTDQIAEWELGSEKKMLSNVFQQLATFKHWEVTLIGYNVLKFDLPFLLFRAEKLGMLDGATWKLLTNDVSWFDLRQFRGKKSGTLEVACSEVGYKPSHPELKGAEMVRFYDLGEYEKVKLHNEDDLRCTEALANALEKDRPIAYP